MAKKRKSVGELSAAETKAFEAQLDLQQRALAMAQAQADRDYESYLRRVEQQRADAEAARQAEVEDAQRAAQFNALAEVAKAYGSQAEQIGSQYDVYSQQVEGQRQAALQQLAAAAARGESTIGEAEAALLRDLVATRAYQDVPLVELGQVQNPLLAGLAAEGASAAGVQAESEQSRQAAAQLAALTRGAMRQLNVGEENYLKALQNAGRFAASQSRQDLAGRQFSVGQGIRSQFDQLAQQIASQRASEVGAAQARAAEARAQQAGYAPIERATPMPIMPEPAFDYAAELEKARLAALAAVRAALPPVPAPVAAPVTAPTGGKKGKKVTDPWAGTSYTPNEFV